MSSGAAALAAPATESSYFSGIIPENYDDCVEGTDG